MKSMYAIFTILLLILAAGCAQQDTTTKPSTGEAFIGGNEGLTMSFLTGAPPDSVFDEDNQFSIGIKLENIGEYDIENTTDISVEVSGINPPDFGVTKDDLKKDSPDALEAASLDSAGNVIKGTTTVVDFDELEYQSKVSGTVTFTLIADVCYEYGTKAQSKLCVLEDLIGKTGEARFCDPNNQNIETESSGAPVQVVSMSENVLGSNKVAFIFKIRNVGAGSLHQQNTECDPSIPIRDKVWVEITDTDLGNLTCSGLKDGTATTGYITLYNKEATVRCTQVIDEPSDFEKIVEFNIRYGYKEGIQKTLEVKQAS